MDWVYLPQILQAVKCYCLYSEKMGAGIWKPTGNFLVQRKRGPGTWMIALRFQSHLTLVMRAQMTKGLYPLPNIRWRSTVKRHFYLNLLSLTAALWTNTLKSVSSSATTRSWVLNYRKYMRGCYRGRSFINSCPLLLSSPQGSLENISTSLPLPSDRTYIFGVCGG